MFQLPSSFCILPFLHHHVNPQGQMTPCCMNEEEMGSVLVESMESIFAGEKFRKLREKFLKGDFPESCASCEKLEGQGVTSLRQSVNQRFKKDVLSMGLLADPSGKLPYYRPKSLDIRFSNTCNFKCRTCGPGCSSSWAKEENLVTLKPLPENILEDVLKIIPDAEEVYFAGGEPLLISENLTVIEEIKKVNPSTRVIYNTNLSSLTFLGMDYLKVWKDLKDLLIIVSLDDLGAKGEYLRSGMRFSKFVENIKKLEQAGIEFQFNIVVSAINIFSLKEMDEFFAREFPLIITEFTLLHTPSHLRISVFPQEIEAILVPYLYALREESSNKSLQSFIELALSELGEDQAGGFADLISAIRLIDHRRGESFTQVYSTHPMKAYL